MSENEPTSNRGAPHCRKNDNIVGYVITSTIYIYICNVCYWGRPWLLGGCISGILRVVIILYIYMVPPLRSTSEHFDILSLHVYIYNIYVHICIRVSYFLKMSCG